MPSNDYLPHWVRADPTQERVLDAVGLTTILDDCASAILPGISVLSRRARYISFHCWARSRVPSGDQTELHAWEVSLAHAEHRLHRIQGEHPVDCSYLGKNNIQEHWNDGSALRDPTRVTQTPGWLGYRPALVTARLVDSTKPFALTDDGVRLASLYRHQAHPPRLMSGSWRTVACLSRLRSAERTALRQILGLQSGGGWKCLETTAWQTRKATIDLIVHGQSVQPALHHLMTWCGRRRSLNAHGRLLVRAGAWSELSFGMTVLLAAWVSHHPRRHPMLVNSLRAARRRRSTADVRDVARDELAQIYTDITPLVIAVQALRDALNALDFLDAADESHLRKLAEDFIAGTDPGSAFEQLTDRHNMIKGSLAWTIPENLATMPRHFAMPGMRIDAMLSLARDVGYKT
jgi:hypothetical protein